MGGHVAIVRDFKDGDWRFFTPWSPIKYRQIYVPGPSTNPADGSYYDDERAIIRNGYTYELVKDSSPLRYVYDGDTAIVKLEDGFRWQDRSGDWIEYGDDKRIRAYGDLQGTIAIIVHNGAGQIAELQDRFNNKVLVFSYIGEALTTVTDHSGRSVRYQRDDKGRLTKVTDVRGNDWLYEYEEFAPSSSSYMLPYFLKSITDPESRVTTIKNVVVGGTVFKELKCEPPGSGTQELKEVVDPDTGMITIEVVDKPGASSGEATCIMPPPQPIPTQMLTDAVIDHDGNRHSYVYSYSGQSSSYLVQEVDADGVQTHRMLGPDGSIARLFRGGELVFSQARLEDTLIRLDSAGNKTKATFDEYNNVIRVENADGSYRTTDYHPSYNLVTRSRDENGIVAEYIYDDQGLITKTIQAKGKPESLEISFEYDQNQQIQSVHYQSLSGEQRQFEFEYDQFGNLIKETVNATLVYQYADFNALGDAQSLIDPRGKHWKYTFDAEGRVLTETDPLLRKTTYQYDKVGNLVKVINPDNSEDLFAYNARNQVRSVTDPYGKVRQYKHNAMGVVTEFTDELGKTSGMVMDRAGRPAYRVDGNQNKTLITSGKDAETNQGAFEHLRRVDYPTYSQVYQYNNRNQVAQLSVIESDKSSTYSFRYDPAGRAIVSTDPNGHSTYYTYDAYGNLVEEDASGFITKYEYNAFGDLTRFTDRNNYVTEFEYDAFGQMTVKRRAGFGEWHYSYDAAGNISVQTDPKGQGIRFEYDDANQLVAEHWYMQSPADPSEPAYKTLTYGYDTMGRLSQWQSGTYSGTFVWDKNGFLSAETVNYGSFNKTYRYGYFDNGTISGLQMPDGTQYSYEYDANNQLTRIQIPGQGSIWVNGFDWRAPTQETLPGGVERHFSYSGLLNIKQFQAIGTDGVPLLSLDYEYSDAAKISQKQLDGDVTTYQYDDIYRLQLAETTSRDGSVRTETYVLDANGNRVGSHSLSHWEYNDAGQLTVRGKDADKTTYQYDANGNLILKSQGNSFLKFTYDPLNRLIRVDNEKDELVAAYDYDPFDRRISKRTSAGQRYFLYADEGLIAEYDDAGLEQLRIGYRPGTLWGTQPVFLYGEHGAGGKKYAYFHNDQLGTPIKLTDASGHIVWDTKFDAFGNAILASSNEVVNPLRFPGQYFDAETGLHYNWRRYYDPTSGRYITPDPIDLAGGPNLYTYVDGDPINRIDPNGECGVFGVLGGLATEYAASKLTGSCFSYGWGDAIGDALCVGRLFKLAKLGKKVPCLGNSFTGDTQVYTETGMRPISDIKVGERVWSYTEWNGQEQFEPVEEVIRNTREYLLVTLSLESDETIVATNQHPFYILGKGWVEAEDLQQGDPLYLSDKRTLHIRAITTEFRTETVYNLSVANANTFFVGKDKVLVHNAKKGCKFDAKPCPKAGKPRDSKGRFTTGAGGNSEDTEIGQLAHEEFKAKAKARGWLTDKRVEYGDGSYGIPDAITQDGRPIELKPDTPSGRAKGRRQLKKYEKALGKKGRVVYYDPKNFRGPKC
nr:RHS repeat-associated core domain-containing protein [Shewanella khirikhana]